MAPVESPSASGRTCTVAASAGSTTSSTDTTGAWMRSRRGPSIEHVHFAEARSRPRFVSGPRSSVRRPVHTRLSTRRGSQNDAIRCVLGAVFPSSGSDRRLGSVRLSAVQTITTRRMRLSVTPTANHVRTAGARSRCIINASAPTLARPLRDERRPTGSLESNSPPFSSSIRFARSAERRRGAARVHRSTTITRRAQSEAFSAGTATRDSVGSTTMPTGFAQQRSTSAQPNPRGFRARVAT
jgi:hypothetical protein